MGTIAILAGALLGAVGVSLGLVKLVDRLARSDEDGGAVQPAEIAERREASKSKPGVDPAAQSIRLYPSPGRECLLAWRASEQAGQAGVCDCLRDTVVLWSTRLRDPLFLAITDEGCAALIDRDPEAKDVRLQVLDMAGVSRLQQRFATDLLAWGTSVDGNHLWCVGEPSLGDQDDSLRLFVFALNQGLAIVATKDPRTTGEADENDAIDNLAVSDAWVELRLKSGKALRVPRDETTGLHAKPKGFSGTMPEAVPAEA